ncbi:glutamate-cysteine ligase family protein [Paractinoplanes rishiriensis]|uniref:Glutamate--cysteine ligase EgtA n=1 Tax=Paractinoplanes rishiriensis TaxID=1050105 RepID=A0A919K5G9_9ACTN|nr:glutamate-cysteine ligase family protein [Actinoplanes rishiriensis]GIE98928.1 glutamate--cysteine ligase EgtA [Actinoplanes rishiriensis]
MTTLTEQTAALLIAARAVAPGPPGFVGAAVDLLLDRPGLPAPAVEALAGRPPLRHGFLTARSPRVVAVSGPPSPGLATCLDRMADDLARAERVIDARILGVAADEPAPERTGPGAGIRIGLEAGLEGGGPHGLQQRWRLAHTLAPVLAAAFANAPGEGWRSVRQAQRRGLPVLPAPADPRAAWTSYVLNAETHDGRSMRARLKAGEVTPDELDRHLAGLHPPVAARGHLEIDIADRQAGNGWQLPIAVAVTLLDDPHAAAEAAVATGALAGEPRLWERAARDALTDPVLAAAARDCFLAAYAALARHGADRRLRDALADFTERYVLRGRTPADDLLDLRSVRP